MRDSAAYILQQFLIQQNVFGDPTVSESAMLWPLFLSHLQDDDLVPDNAAAIYDTSGLKDGRYMGGPSDFGMVVEHPGIMLRVRSRDRQDGFDKLKAAAEFMSTLAGTGVTVGGHPYVINNVSQVGTVAFTGVDQAKRRSEHTLNFLCTLTPGDGTIQPVAPDQQGVLLNGVPKTLLQFAVVPGDAKGGTIEYFVKTSDGVNSQAVSGEITFVATNKGGHVTGNVQSNADQPAADAPSGTTIQVDGYFDGADPSKVKVGLTVTVAGFTPTTMQVFFSPELH